MKGAIVTVFSKRRERYLPFYIPALRSYLEKTSQELDIIVSEQIDYNTTFNFNISANVGLRAAFESLNCDYAIIVGPDNIPLEKVDYSWSGKNETSFLMYGGYKIDKNSFYKSNGNNVFMGWGWGWQDVEFYDRLDFYGILHEAWYTKQAAIESKIIDLSSRTNTERSSIDQWIQGRHGITLDQVPKILPPHEAGVNFEPYEENYWYSNIVKEAHINLSYIIRHLPPEERERYYSVSGYKSINMNNVKHSREEGVNYFRYNTHDVFSDSNSYPEIKFPISKRALENSPRIKELEYQLVGGKIVKLDFL
jgi:hypothetical protein